MMSEWITYSTHTPAVFFVFDRRNHSGASSRGTRKNRVWISHDHDHAHHGAAKISPKRLGAEVQKLGGFIGHPKLCSSDRHLRYHAFSFLADAEQLLRSKRFFVKLNCLCPAPHRKHRGYGS